MEEFVDLAFGETWPDYFGRRALPGATGEELAEIAAPYVDIKEKERKIIVAADIPGVEKGDISMNVDITGLPDALARETKKMFDISLEKVR